MTTYLNRPDGRTVRVRRRTRPSGGNVVPFPAGEVPAQVGGAGVEDPDPGLRAVRRLNREHALILLGGKHRILWETATSEQGFELLEPGTFHALYASRVIEPDDPKSPPATQVWFKHPERRTLRGVTFAPGQTTTEHYNTWRGFAVQPNPEGSCALFLEHLRVNVAQGNERHYRWMLGWFAQMIQQPAAKLGTSLALRGRQGTGKTIIGETFRKLFPAHYVLLDQAGQLTGRFSGHLDSKLLIHADEAFFAGSRAELGRLKNLVTRTGCRSSARARTLSRCRTSPGC
jgi:Family of unknown function (DUF5906)